MIGNREPTQNTVDNLPLNIHISSLNRLFDRYGHVRDIFIPRKSTERGKSCYAFVQYGEENECM